jgi:hypothetical protein
VASGPSRAGRVHCKSRSRTRWRGRVWGCGRRTRGVVDSGRQGAVRSPGGRATGNGQGMVLCRGQSVRANEGGGADGARRWLCCRLIVCSRTGGEAGGRWRHGRATVGRYGRALVRGRPWPADGCRGGRACSGRAQVLPCRVRRARPLSTRRQAAARRPEQHRDDRRADAASLYSASHARRAQGARAAPASAAQGAAPDARKMRPECKASA